MRHPYVSIDTETTGLDPETCQVIEIGAVIDDWTTPFSLLPKFRCYVDHGTFVGQPYALSMHASIFRAIATGKKAHEGQNVYCDSGWREGDGVAIYTPGIVTGIFLDWLQNNHLHLRDEKIVVAGKNYGSFDHQFLRQLPNFGDYVQIKHRYIDPGNLYYNPTMDQGPPSMQDCMARANIKGEVSHTAIEDAMTVVKLIRHWERYRG